MQNTSHVNDLCNRRCKNTFRDYARVAGEGERQAWHMSFECCCWWKWELTAWMDLMCTWEGGFGMTRWDDFWWQGWKNWSQGLEEGVFMAGLSWIMFLLLNPAILITHLIYSEILRFLIHFFNKFLIFLIFLINYLTF